MHCEMNRFTLGPCRARHPILSLVACSAIAFACSVVAQPQIEIVNPNATFPAQQRALAPAEVIERGDGLYQVNCMACHGRDLRGGDQGGPNLLRSNVVLNDVEGELIGQIVRTGINRMPPITTLDADDIEAVAGYIHSIVATSERQGAPPRVDYDLDIVVGNARRGRNAFGETCSGCHSVTGDLEGLAAEVDDPMTLQNTWVAGRRQGRFGGGSTVPTRVTVTPRNGAAVSGELLRHDDFFVSLRTEEGDYRSFSRLNGRVAIEIDDPLARHKELWAELEDATIHDITAYLESLR